MNTQFLDCLDDYINKHKYRLINSIIIYEDSKLVFERYYNKFTPSSRNNIKSVWKSILSLTLGICIEMGAIRSIDDKVFQYLPAFKEDIHPYHKFLTLRHLLNMTSGIYWQSGIHYHCPMMNQLRRSKNWVEHIANVQMKALPGTVFLYKEWDCILLSAVISNATGKTAWEICSQYLYTPLGIQGGKWPTTNCGLNYNVMQGEESSDLSAHDLAKIGLLMLNNGKWEGRQIVANEYIRLCIEPSERNIGYGLFWWLHERYYAAQGLGGQEIRIYPKEKVVAVIQATPTPSGRAYFDILDECMKD